MIDVPASIVGDNEVLYDASTALAVFGRVDPTRQDPPSTFLSDPADPAINPFESAGAHDYRALADRRDVHTFSRNLHTGDVETISARMQRATIRVYHDREPPSQVSLHVAARRLPVVENH